MSRSAFHAQLDALNQELESMGRLVQQAIANAVTALEARDTDLARAVIEGDSKVNEAYFKVEQMCLSLLALQQPIAGDLRRIASTLKVITDMERMADHAVSIAKVTLRLGKEPLVKPLVDIPAMAKIVQEMVANAIQAFVQGDRALGMAMIERDHDVDNLHHKVIDDLQALMLRDPSAVPQGIQLLFVSAGLERIGDYSTNLGEWLIYRETGVRSEMNL